MKHLVYFVLASFVTVDINTEEKGLFKGRKCLARGHQLQITIPVSPSLFFFFFVLNLATGSLLRPGSGHATLCQDKRPQMCSNK